VTNKVVSVIIWIEQIIEGSKVGISDVIVWYVGLQAFAAISDGNYNLSKLQRGERTEF
jgi:hypothetical protein